MVPAMITCSCFTAREDRATLRSDPSARAGLREAVCMSMLPFYHCLPETKAPNLGVRSRATITRRTEAADNDCSMDVLLKVELTLSEIKEVHSCGNNAIQGKKQEVYEGVY